MFAIAWYGFLILLGLVALPFIVKKQGSALQRLFRITVGFALWGLLIFSDVLLQKAFLGIACNLPLSLPVESKPPSAIHIGALQGQECDDRCQKALYINHIPAVTAIRLGSGKNSSLDDRQQIRFWLEPCDSDPRGFCVKSLIESAGNVSWDVDIRPHQHVLFDSEISPIRISWYQIDWVASHNQRVFATQRVWNANFSWAKAPLNLVYRTKDTCETPLHHAYPELYSGTS